MVLLFWQFVPLPFADRNESYTAPTISIQPTIADKLPQKGLSLYKNVLITKENLKGALEVDFAKYGILDQLDRAEKVLQCESGFQVDPPHNNSCRGIAQFKVSTWDWFNKVRETHMEFMNPFSQIDMMSWAWSKGYQSQWECFYLTK